VFVALTLQRRLNVEKQLVRAVHGHEGSTLNNGIVITADARDENGGSHTYLIDVTGGAPESGGMQCEVSFQNGPLQEAGHNGISDEALLAIVIDRLEGFQSAQYRSRYNALAITKLEEAMHWLNARTSDRQKRGVEGTHKA
jgi:hypothetical protein